MKKYLVGVLQYRLGINYKRSSIIENGIEYVYHDFYFGYHFIIQCIKEIIIPIILDSFVILLIVAIAFRSLPLYTISAIFCACVYVNIVLRLILYAIGLILAFFTLPME